MALSPSPKNFESTRRRLTYSSAATMSCSHHGAKPGDHGAPRSTAHRASDVSTHHIAADRKKVRCTGLSSSPVSKSSSGIERPSPPPPKERRRSGAESSAPDGTRGRWDAWKKDSSP